MEALRFNYIVGEDGIIIGASKLKQFKNKRVEIIIIPLEEEEKKEKKNFFNAIGKINIDEKEIDTLRDLSKL